MADLHVPLSNGLVAVVEAADGPLVQGRRWHARKGRTTTYAAANLQKPDGSWTMVSMHRLILADCALPEVDHRDGDGLNNRRSNLRGATHSQNQANQRPSGRGSSPYKGVSWYARHQKWRALIVHGGRQISLGYHTTAEAAALAYNAAALELYGEFAWLNEVPT